MDARIVDHYFPSACIGGLISSVFIAAYFYIFQLSASDVRAINTDGLAAMYLPIIALIFAIPGAIVGVVVQFVSERFLRSRK